MLIQNIFNRILPWIILLAVLLSLSKYGNVNALNTVDKGEDIHFDSNDSHVPISDDMDKSVPITLSAKPKQKSEDDVEDGSVTENSDAGDEQPKPTPKDGKKKSKKKKDGKWGKRFKKLFNQLPRWVRYSVLVGSGVVLLATLIGITRCYKRYRY